MTRIAVILLAIALLGCSPMRRTPLQELWEWKCPVGPDRTDYFPSEKP